MNFVLSLDDKQFDTLLDYYKNVLSKSNNHYQIGLVKKEGLTIQFYKSKKVMFQGKEALEHYEYWMHRLDITKNDKDFYLTSIGSDESGVGDYFGPLTVCAAYVDQSSVDKLKGLNIKDSKSLSDDTIVKLAEKLVTFIPYSLLVLPNKKYNEQFDKGLNAHSLKAHLHAQTHKKLQEKIQHAVPIVIDQFCSETLYKNYLKASNFKIYPSIFETKAEDKFASVAIASIIARYAYIKAMDKLSEKLGVTLLKGASKHVDEQALYLVKKHGESILDTIAKKHFITTKKVLNNL